MKDTKNKIVSDIESAKPKNSVIYDKIYSCMKSGSSLNGYSFIKECD